MQGNMREAGRRVKERAGHLVQVLQLLPAQHRILAVALFAVLMVALLYLGGCANLAQPETVEQRLAYAEAQQAALANTVADLYQAGAIERPQLLDARDNLEQSAQALDAAWSALAAANRDQADQLAAQALQLIRTTRQAVEARTDE